MGTVARIIQINRSYVKVVVQIKEGNKSRFVEGGLIARNMKNVISHVMVGSRICAVFEIRTSKKEVDGKPVYRKQAFIVDLKEV